MDVAEYWTALRVSLQRLEWRDSFRLGALPLRMALYDARRHRSRPAPIVHPRPGGVTPTTSAVPEALVEQRATELFHVCPPPGAVHGMRGAGARRLPWSTESAPTGDIQDTHAWHRLYWVLENPMAGQGALEHWLARSWDDHELHPYATSERIRVLAELLGTFPGALSREARRQVIERIRWDAHWLYDRVEVALGIQNHPLNNARALCAAAYLLEGESAATRWLSRARELWDAIFPKLILADGVFGEQSTHYHVLLTRTLLEYWRDAKRSGRQLPSAMAEKARRMCRVTNHLVRPDGTMPLFGDVSPDHPTMWLQGIPRCCAAAGLLDERPRDTSAGYAGGASALFADVGEQEVMADEFDRDWALHLYREGGLLWARSSKLGVELAAHGDPRPEVACHGDTGRGTFEIWRSGRPLVVDGGMPTYEGGPVRAHFLGVWGQNTIVVNGLSPCVLRHAAADLPTWYVAGLDGGDWHVSESEARFVWHGFSRGRAGLTWTRRWILGSDSICVEDRLDGAPGAVHIGSALHLAGSGWCRTDRDCMSCDAVALRYSGPGALRMSVQELPYSTNYGVLEQASGVVLEGRLPLPAVWAWHFEFPAEQRDGQTFDGVSRQGPGRAA